MTLKSGSQIWHGDLLKLANKKLLKLIWWSGNATLTLLKPKNHDNKIYIWR